MTIHSQMEAILFVEAKAVSFAQLARILKIEVAMVKEAATELSAQLDEHKRGLRVLITESSVQMVTAPELYDIVAAIVKDERTGELTRPSLEALSIIAYRSPVTKAELEMIRGVNCSMILRNLLIRGLISETFDKAKGIEVYDITPEYLQLLGVSKASDLPNYQELSRDISLEETLAEMGNSDDFFRQVEHIGEKDGQS